MKTTATPVSLNKVSAMRETGRLKKWALSALVAIVVALIMGFVWWPKSLENLGKGDNMTTAGFYSSWEAGNVVMLVRHAERCDRSNHPCLGPADGITRIGSDTAVELGKALKTLGMSKADVFTSPLHRTAQTAFSMLGKASVEQEWLVNCEQAMLDNVVAHKIVHRNLVLVTHSGCIGKLESQLGYTHAPTAEYTSALLITLGPDNQPKALGYMNVQDWQATLDKKP
ncbi:MAG: Ais protein [Pseudomonas sp.]|nr:Ais protein [Pseudomonas sp.]